MKADDANITHQMIEIAKGHGFGKCGIVPLREFVFHKSLHDLCATNQCGMFNTNWSCPPGLGAYEDLIAKLQSFDQGLVVQSVWTIADCFDIEGMLEFKNQHNAMLRSMVDDLYPLLKNARKMTLGVGHCSLCNKCTYLENKPCRMPEQAFGALEAYGVDVAVLLDRCGLKYNNGPDTVSYVGAVVFEDIWGTFAASP